MVQISHNLKGPCVSYVCDMCGVNHTCVGFLNSTCMYTLAHTCIITRVHACMANIVSYLPFNSSYNATVLVTLFFSYRVLAAHQGVEDKTTEEVESTSLILKLANSYLMEAFLLPEVTIYYTRCSAKSHH